MIDEKSTEQFAEKNDEKPTPKKKSGFSDLTKKAWAGIKEAAKDVKELADTKIEQHKEHEAFKKAYSSATYLFEFRGINDRNGKPKTIRAFRNQMTKELEVYIEEENIGLVLSNTVLQNLNDQSLSKIVTVETKEIRYHNVEYDKLQKKIPCYVASYERYVEEKQNGPQIVHTEVHQNLNNYGTLTGDVTQVSDVNVKLEQFEEQIKAVNTKLLSKERKAKEEAIKIYGNVKNCIIGGKKDDSIVKKFLELLSVFAPFLVAAFKALL